MGRHQRGTQEELNVLSIHHSEGTVLRTWASQSGSVGSKESPLFNSSVTLGKLTSVSVSPFLSNSNKGTLVLTCMKVMVVRTSQDSCESEGHSYV